MDVAWLARAPYGVSNTLQLALRPTELCPLNVNMFLVVVGDEGLEPPTSSLSVTRSNQLS